ncbi:hypothetical protein BUALT_Bualt01G0049100 [Buddleja alternifolia]|uniref:Nuclear pore complex protein n=1 Tax=Buddleja alternifolia TaxID=168488 RepID=A0AAV6YB65_9LAMI|nr:hypothetical protein BUALT_Bualt01G0049100 [Buddleja alternifolia]
MLQKHIQDSKSKRNLMKRKKDVTLHAIRQETPYTLDSENSSGEEEFDGQHLDHIERMESRQLRNAMRESRKTAAFEDEMHNRYGYGHVGAGSSHGPTLGVKRGISRSQSVKDTTKSSSRDSSRGDHSYSGGSSGRYKSVDEQMQSLGLRGIRQVPRGYSYGSSNDNRIAHEVAYNPRQELSGTHGHFDGYLDYSRNRHHGHTSSTTSGIGYHGTNYGSSGGFSGYHGYDYSSGASGARYRAHDYGSSDSAGSSSGYRGFGYYRYHDDSLSSAYPIHSTTYNAPNQPSQPQGEQLESSRFAYPHGLYHYQHDSHRSDTDDFVPPRHSTCPLESNSFTAASYCERKMRFAFDSPEPGGRQSPAPSPSNSTPKVELQWVPLQNHPLFSAATAAVTPAAAGGRMPPNLMAWDGASRLYFWDSNRKCLHRISIRLGEPDPTSILAAFPSKMLQADSPLSFEVNKISINRNGSALLLVGLEGLRVMYLYGRSSMEENTIICRTVSIGSEIYFDRNNSIRILQISWHPYSDTHLGILSSDNVFRIFDMSTSIEQPEQEYYLQPVEPGTSRNAASICPVDFSFGGDHLWDKFSEKGLMQLLILQVFILFSDGSSYIICPVVPFGSVYKWESVLEIYNDAHTLGLKSANPRAVNNSNLAISWLEATFPELVRQAGDGGKLYAVKAQPFVLLDASGPLRKISHGATEDSEIQKGVCEGRAVSLLYNLVGKDSILVTAWSGGQLQFDALADEIQPVWKTGSAPRLCVDSSDQILGAAMICESAPIDRSMLQLDQPSNHTLWLGHPPPLLRLAIVDLALPNKNNSLISMITDPLVPERIFCIHSGGVDSVILHFLPFTSQTSGKEEPMRVPCVLSVLSTCPGDTSSPSPLHGVLALSDSFGSSWIVGLTSVNECVVLQMETWNVLLTHVVDKERESVISPEVKETDIPTIISKELLSGPKTVLLPPSAPNLRSVIADSIEGRSMLHQYFKLFHENYVEYAHKVYFELQHHAPQLKKIIDNQNSRLRELEQKLSGVEENQENIRDRIDRALRLHSSLEERLQNLRSLPGAHKKPLSKAERDFKLELDKFTGVEVDALHSSIEALSARLRRNMHSPESNSSTQQRQKPGRWGNRVKEDEVSQLKSSLAKLTHTNSENSKKVKLLESALRTKEITD